MVTFVVLILLILLHELGHFAAAKKFGVRVDEFGIGLPPKALTIVKKGDTEYTLNWLPLGGFVRLFGEDGDLTLFEKLNPFVKKQSFAGKPARIRALILLAGVTMNLLIGILLFSFVYSVTGVPHVSRNQVAIAQVVSGSPAEAAGMKESEVITAIDGEPVETSEQFVAKIADKKGTRVNFQVSELLPDGTVSSTPRDVSAVPRIDPPAGQGSLGVAVVTLPILAYEKKPWYSAPFYGAVDGMKESYAWGREILKTLPKLFGSFAQGKIPEGTTGPVGVVKEGNRIFKQAGILGSLRFGAILSINLAIFNLLPFPGLDGGRLIFLGFEKIFGRKRVNKYENYIHMGGILLLILLLVVVTWRDLFVK